MPVCCSLFAAVHVLSRSLDTTPVCRLCGQPPGRRQRRRRGARSLALLLLQRRLPVCRPAPAAGRRRGGGRAAGPGRLGPGSRTARHGCRPQRGQRRAAVLHLRARPAGLPVALVCRPGRPVPLARDRQRRGRPARRLAAARRARQDRLCRRYPAACRPAHARAAAGGHPTACAHAPGRRWQQQQQKQRSRWDLRHGHPLRRHGRPPRRCAAGAQGRHRGPVSQRPGGPRPGRGRRPAGTYGRGRGDSRRRGGPCGCAHLVCRVCSVVGRVCRFFRSEADGPGAC